MLAAAALENSWGIKYRQDVKPSVYAAAHSGYHNPELLAIEAIRKTNRWLFQRFLLTLLTQDRLTSG